MRLSSQSFMEHSFLAPIVDAFLCRIGSLPIGKAEPFGLQVVLLLLLEATTKANLSNVSGVPSTSRRIPQKYSEANLVVWPICTRAVNFSE